jgi:hypothetical protein
VEIGKETLKTVLVIDGAGHDPETLQRSERRYGSIFENAPIGIFHSTLAGRLLSVNPAFARLRKFESPEALIQEANRSNIAGTINADPSRCRPAWTLPPPGPWDSSWSGR